MWFDHGFIIGLGALLVHQYHQEDIEVINVLYSKSKVTTREMISLHLTVTRVFSVLHSTQVLHYVVADVRPSNKDIFIFDGFGCALMHWLRGVNKVLLQCNLVSGESNVTVIKKTDYHYILQDKTNGSTVYGLTVFIKQHNGNSCGPIACLKLLDVFGCIPDSINSLDELSGTQLRCIVMDCYNRVRKDVKDDIRLLNKMRKRKDAPGFTAGDKYDDLEKNKDIDEKPVDLITPEKKKHKKEDSEVNTAREVAIGKKKEFHQSRQKR